MGKKGQDRGKLVVSTDVHHDVRGLGVWIGLDRILSPLVFFIAPLDRKSLPVK